MYLAIRDIRFAKGRFALMGAVVALITLLLVMLSGLTAGLGNQSTSALAALPADQLVFGATAGSAPKASFTESEVTRAQQAQWTARDGVSRADALGISQSRFQALGAGGVPARTASVAVFGTEPGTGLASAALAEGTVVVGAGLAAELDLSIGSRASVGGADLIVTAIVPEQWYSHTSVVWTTLNDWHKLAHNPGGGAATVLAVKFDGGKSDAGTTGAAPGVDIDAANAAAGTVSTTVEGSFQALGSYKSENGSLLLMQAFLYGISALVIVAFLTVWTVQRTRDIAVLKALGGSARYILRDALAQAALVLLAGAAAGGLAGLAGGAVASQAAPVLLTPGTTLLPIAGIVILGLAGAALAVRSVARVDPLIALGGN